MGAVVVDEGVPGARRVRRADPSGWCVDAHVVDLPGGGTAVYAPVRGGGASFGDARLVVAPNHYHHLGLAEARAAAPSAVACAHAVGLPRLGKQGHQGLVDAAEVAVDGVELLPAPGTKNGECWAFFPAQRLLLVCDAFFHVGGPVRGFTGFVLRRLRTAPGLKLGRTFVWLALADVPTYRAWADETLARLAPAAVGFSHGETLIADDAGEQLRAVLRATLG